MIKIAIVEDDPACAKLIKNYIEQYQEETHKDFVAAIFGNGIDFISDYGDGFDIVLMDIEMPMMDGLETARRLRRLDETVSLIFITNMAQYAINGYEVNALDFIVKPVGYFNFTMKIEKALRQAEKHKDTTILLNTDNGNILMNISDIYYIEGSGHYVIYHTLQGDYKMRTTMKETEVKFRYEKFMRCNASYLVNFEYVSKISGSDVFVHGDKLPISRSRQKEFINALTVYFENGGVSRK